MAGVGGEARGVEARIADIVSHLDLWGIIGAAALFTLGLTPSILPRDWLYQGLVSGIAAGLGLCAGHRPQARVVPTGGALCGASAFLA